MREQIAAELELKHRQELARVAAEQQQRDAAMKAALDAAAKKEQQLKAAAAQLQWQKEQAEREKEAAKMAEVKAQKDKEEAERKAAEQGKALVEAKAALISPGGAAFYGSFRGDFELPVPKSQLQQVSSKVTLRLFVYVMCEQVFRCELSSADEGHKPIIARVFSELGPKLASEVKSIQVCVCL